MRIVPIIMAGRRIGARPFAAALLLFLAACATPEAARIRAEPGTLPARAEVAQVPFIPQEAFYCGPAALTMALAWSGLEVTQSEVAAEVYTPGREGTLASDLLAGARRHGRLAVRLHRLDQVLAELAAGHPVIVFQNLGLAWYPVWHFAVAVGYDLDDGVIVLHSGLDERRVTRLTTFERTWRRSGGWALAVLPPDTLPAAADEAAVLRAAVGLERTGRAAEAAVSYAAILGRWPESLAGWIGLGNARYAAGDLAGAERALRGAIAADPAAPAAWNNLAHVLAERGRRGAAVAAAREAVRLAGTDAALYQATLREVAVD